MSEEIQPEKQNETIKRMWGIIEKDPIKLYDLRKEILNEARNKIGPEIVKTQIYHAISGSSVEAVDNFPWDVEGGLIEAFLKEKLDKIESSS